MGAAGFEPTSSGFSHKSYTGAAHSTRLNYAPNSKRDKFLYYKDLDSS